MKQGRTTTHPTTSLMETLVEATAPIKCPTAEHRDSEGGNPTCTVGVSVALETGRGREETTTATTGGGETAGGGGSGLRRRVFPTYCMPRVQIRTPGSAAFLHLALRLLLSHLLELHLDLPSFTGTFFSVRVAAVKGSALKHLSTNHHSAVKTHSLANRIV